MSPDHCHFPDDPSAPEIQLPTILESISDSLRRLEGPKAAARRIDSDEVWVAVVEVQEALDRLSEVLGGGDGR